MGKVWVCEDQVYGSLASASFQRQISVCFNIEVDRVYNFSLLTDKYN